MAGPTMRESVLARLARGEAPPTHDRLSRENFDAGFATFVTSQVRQLRRALTVVPESNLDPKDS
jgi:hypothetical protein